MIFWIVLAVALLMRIVGYFAYRQSKLMLIPRNDHARRAFRDFVYTLALPLSLPARRKSLLLRVANSRRAHTAGSFRLHHQIG
jgi:hypothetical protein